MLARSRRLRSGPTALAVTDVAPIEVYERVFDGIVLLSLELIRFKRPRHPEEKEKITMATQTPHSDAGTAARKAAATP